MLHGHLLTWASELTFISKLKRIDEIFSSSGLYKRDVITATGERLVRLTVTRTLTLILIILTLTLILTRLTLTLILTLTLTLTGEGLDAPPRAYIYHKCLPGFRTDIILYRNGDWLTKVRVRVKVSALRFRLRI